MDDVEFLKTLGNTLALKNDKGLGERLFEIAKKLKVRGSKVRIQCPHCGMGMDVDIVVPSWKQQSLR